MRLRAQGVNDSDDGVGRVRRARRISDDKIGVVRGQVIYDVSKESDTMTEAVVDR